MHSLYASLVPQDARDSATAAMVAEAGAVLVESFGSLAMVNVTIDNATSPTFATAIAVERNGTLRASIVRIILACNVTRISCLVGGTTCTTGVSPPAIGTEGEPLALTDLTVTIAEGCADVDGAFSGLDEDRKLARLTDGPDVLPSACGPSTCGDEAVCSYTKPLVGGTKPLATPTCACVAPNFVSTSASFYLGSASGCASHHAGEEGAGASMIALSASNAPYEAGCATPRAASYLSIVGEVESSVVVELHKTASLAPSTEVTVELTMGGSGIAAAEWAVNSSGLPNWLSLGATNGTIAATDDSMRLTLELSSARVAERGPAYVAHVPITVRSQVIVTLAVPVFLSVTALTVRATWGIVTNYDVGACALPPLAAKQEMLTVGVATVMEFTACDHEDVPVSHSVPSYENPASFTVQVASVIHADGPQGSATVVYSAVGRYNAMITVDQLGEYTLSLLLNGSPVGAIRTVSAVCPVGRVELANQKDCGCAAGQELDNTVGLCVLCGAGTFKEVASSDPCTPCAPGTYRPSLGATKCLSCPISTYNNQTGAASCLECPNRLTSLGASVTCPYCVENYYDTIDGPEDVKCAACPIGSDCQGSGNTLALLPLRPGYWRTNSGSPDLRPCPDASSPDTTSCANLNGVICKPWTTGPYCRTCNVTGSRHFDLVQSACVLCGDTAATSLATLVGIVAAVLFLLCWCGSGKPCKPLRNVVYRTMTQIRAPLKQMVAFYQVRSSCDASVRSPFISLIAPPPWPLTDRNARRERLQGHNASIRGCVAPRF